MNGNVTFNAPGNDNSSGNVSTREGLAEVVDEAYHESSRNQKSIQDGGKYASQSLRKGYLGLVPGPDIPGDYDPTAVNVTQSGRLFSQHRTRRAFLPYPERKMRADFYRDRAEQAEINRKFLMSHRREINRLHVKAIAEL
jgi:hypothetical protein